MPLSMMHRADRLAGLPLLAKRTLTWVVRSPPEPNYIIQIQTTSNPFIIRAACHYPQKAPGADLENLDRDSLISTIQRLERTLDEDRRMSENYDTPSPFPIAFFLDPEFLTLIAHSALYSHRPAPLMVMEYIGSDVADLCQLYFLTIHQWFPFIIKKRLLQNLARFEHNHEADIALLLLCMKLLSTPPCTDTPGSREYFSARSLKASLDGAGMISLPLLQATTLLALYEISHGILPAGYLTVGLAARIGIMMGLHCSRNATQLLKLPDTLTLREEERRTWWTILILERYINLGPRGLALATPEPCQGHLLPITDGQWDKGEIGGNEPLYTTRFSSPGISQFGRTAQAAHVLGKVLYHRAGYSQEDRMTRLEEALQLHHTLSALDNHIIQAQRTSSEEQPFHCSIDLAICCSARMTLYNIYGCNEPADLHFGSQSRYAEESEMQTIALGNITQVASERVVDLAQGVLQSGEDGLITSSPLLIECIYHAATECQWFIREGMGQSIEQSYRTLADTLRLLTRTTKLISSPENPVKFSIAARITDITALLMFKKLVEIPYPIATIWSSSTAGSSVGSGCQGVILKPYLILRRADKAIIGAKQDCFVLRVTFTGDAARDSSPECNVKTEGHHKYTGKKIGYAIDAQMTVCGQTLVPRMNTPRDMSVTIHSANTIPYDSTSLGVKLEFTTLPNLAIHNVTASARLSQLNRIRDLKDSPLSISLNCETGEEWQDGVRHGVGGVEHRN
ncbi:hypothetical protein B7463_g10029, partial [Scytalidium lignicola]